MKAISYFYKNKRKEHSIHLTTNITMARTPNGIPGALQGKIVPIAG